MKTIYFSFGDNKDLNITDTNAIAKTTARIMERDSSEDTISVDADDELINEHCIENGEETTIEWNIINIDYDGGVISSVDIDC